MCSPLLKTRANGAGAILVFVAAIALIQGSVAYCITRGIDWAQAWVHARKEIADSPKAAELLGSFSTVKSPEKMIWSASCGSGVLDRESTLASIEATASILELLVRQGRQLLDSDGTLSAKDRRLLGEKSAIAERNAAMLRVFGKGLQACSVRSDDKKF